MRRQAWPSVLAMLALLPLAGCEKGGDGGSEATVEWPEQPANGAPVALAFEEMIGEGEDLGARMQVFNFSAQAVRRLSLTLHYQNEAGEDLDTFPWGMSAGQVVGASGHDEVEVGAFVPEGTTRVEADVLEVEFADGSTWQRPE